ncbi:MAG: hypothetical protein WCB62_14320, partial [Pseudolabrys sp.]
SSHWRVAGPLCAQNTADEMCRHCLHANVMQSRPAIIDGGVLALDIANLPYDATRTWRPIPKNSALRKALPGASVSDWLKRTPV